MAARLPFTQSRDGICLAVRLTPKAAADRIVGVIEDGRGGCALKAAVKAPPVDGKANAALIMLLARQFGLRRRDLAVTQGTHDRSKVITVSGNPATLAGLLMDGLSPWLARG